MENIGFDDIQKQNVTTVGKLLMVLGIKTKRNENVYRTLLVHCWFTAVSL